MTVLVGIDDINLDAVRDLSDSSEHSGADALAAMFPYYFGPSTAVCEQYYRAIAKASALPILCTIPRQGRGPVSGLN